MPDIPETPSAIAPAHHPLAAWVACCLADEPRPPAGELPLEAAAAEGVLPWLAWRLQESGALSALPAGQQTELRDALRQWGLMHLDCEGELERLAQSASERGLRLIAFKGHSVARTLYPNPACRPTSDFDLLIDPAQVAAARAWLADMGYSPLQNFVGTVWLGAQSWSWPAGDLARFHADLHWDYSNRMYFRNRLPFAAIRAASQEVPCGGGKLRLPCPVDDLILACVHLAAFKRGVHVRLVWLLDIYLLMAALDEADIPLLLERAGQARAVEACLEFGERAAALGDRRVLEPVLMALQGVASEKRTRAYQRTLRWRTWELAAYWLRLPVQERVAIFGDMVRWLEVGRKRP